ncbi:glycerol-3-phosphate dehydrogenase/oxidase [Arenibacter certesii]|uniref:Glycerol-3-phosphate dehydrogenase n=1 Tax=Arenibacter certesii TaxID=228955 RepID=A0A918MID7_9FLAO|nr:glycerol-3-phosphate dehydrogenase/oxidase [Arenibacter certesii]GGW24815.1 glycerol-3-phosphate dehydrogenase [Arenibacter certesii]
MDLFKREAILQHLDSPDKWDVIIIGGGATGLGVAIDSVVRGYRTLLLEQVDYAKGTSSRSTKLVHGGVRYLAQGDLGLVKEALYERGLLLKNAPHLVKNQSFIIPNYRWWGGMFYTVGLKVYDVLAGKLSLGKSVHINRKETASRLGTLNTHKLKGGVLYHDGQFDDSRLAVNIAQTCIEKGATLLNHFQVTQLTKDGEGIVNGVVAKDVETNKEYVLPAKVVINATGVFTDQILKMDNRDAKNMVRPSQGIHLVLDKSFLPGEDAIMIPKTDDGRVLFLVPWHNRVLIGTTDTILDDHSLEPVALEKEIDFIIETANSYLTKKVTRADVLSIFAGLRPLAAPKDESEKTKEISRSHKIIVSKSHLITITGGKWTTYRKMAQDTIDKVIRIGKLPKRACATQHLPIHGSTREMESNDHLYAYGSDRTAILELMAKSPELGKKLHPNLEFFCAEVVWAVRCEMARTVEDVLARRVRALFLDAKASVEMAPKVAEIMALEMNKDLDWQKKQVTAYNAIAAQYVLQEIPTPPLDKKQKINL